MLKLIPGIDAGIFDDLKAHYRALVIESFGVGGLPCYGDESFLHAVRDWVQSGRVIVMTTQVPHEGSDMEVYQVGHRAKRELGLIEAYSMTSEAVVTKLMWILGQTDDYAEICRLFRTRRCRRIRSIEEEAPWIFRQNTAASCARPPRRCAR
ncbi:MAG: hypothetical protein ACLSHG_13240 [Oscillospiraceae bacterium]